MATVTGVTAARANSIEDRLIVAAARQGTSLVFTTEGGQVINIANAFPAMYESTPVGGLFFGTSSANPSTYLGGGKWARWGKGRVPVGVDEADPNFNTVEKEGGASEVAITVAQMPAHDHGANTGYQSHDHSHTGYAAAGGSHTHGQAIPYHRTGISGGGGLSVADNSNYVQQTDAAGYHDHSVSTYGASSNHYHSITAQGGGAAHSNLQKYITCYIWKRMPDNWGG